MTDTLKHYGRLALAVLFVLALVGAYRMGGNAVRNEWALADAQRVASTATAELAGFRREAKQLFGISEQLETDLANLRQAQPKIIERYSHVVTEKPLPADCRLDAGRLRELNAAIDAANATGQSDGTVPGSGTAGD